MIKELEKVMTWATTIFPQQQTLIVNNAYDYK